MSVGVPHPRSAGRRLLKLRDEAARTADRGRSQPPRGHEYDYVLSLTVPAELKFAQVSIRSGWPKRRRKRLLTLDKIKQKDHTA
jgi:hypothetical protein